MKIKIILAALCCGITLTSDLSAQIKQTKQHTPLTEIELAQVLKDSHQSVFGFQPKETTLSNAWAQIAFENGRGKKIYNNNLGNLGAGKNDNYYKVGGSKFLSFDSSLIGAENYWKFLAKRCPMALKNFRFGQTEVATNYLKQCGYYRVDSQVYLKNMISLRNVALGRIIPQLDKK